jgi:hypothetical protein
VKHPAGVGFAGVDTGCDKNDFLLVLRVRIRFDVQIFNSVASQGLAKVKPFPSFGIQKLTQHGVSVGRTVREVEGINANRKLIGKAEGIQIATTGQKVIHSVGCFVAASLPRGQFIITLFSIAVED